MARIFTVARHMSDETDDGTLRLVVDTDIPYSDAEVDRLADIIDAIEDSGPTFFGRPTAEHRSASLEKGVPVTHHHPDLNLGPGHAHPLS